MFSHDESSGGAGWAMLQWGTLGLCHSKDLMSGHKVAVELVKRHASGASSTKLRWWLGTDITRTTEASVIKKIKELVERCTIGYYLVLQGTIRVTLKRSDVRCNWLSSATLKAPLRPNCAFPPSPSPLQTGGGFCHQCTAILRKDKSIRIEAALLSTKRWVGRFFCFFLLSTSPQPLLYGPGAVQSTSWV